MDWRRTTRPARGEEIWGVSPNPDAGKETPKRKRSRKPVVILVLAMLIILAAVIILTAGI